MSKLFSFFYAVTHSDALSTLSILDAIRAHLAAQERDALFSLRDAAYTFIIEIEAELTAR